MIAHTRNLVKKLPFHAYHGIGRQPLQTTHRSFSIDLVSGISSTAAIVGTLGTVWGAFNYKTAHPSEAFVVTGPFVKDNMKICKTHLRLPFQLMHCIDMSALNVPFTVNGMTKEKIPFALPITIVIHPNSNDELMLKEYATRFSGMPIDQFILLVKSVAQGSVRQQLGECEAVDLVTSRDTVYHHIEKTLHEVFQPFGIILARLSISDILDLDDGRGLNYFRNISERKVSEGNREAEVAIKENESKAIISKVEYERNTREAMAKTRAEAIQAENLSQQMEQESTAKLEILKSKLDRDKTKMRLEVDEMNAIQKSEMEQKIAIAQRSQLLEQERCKLLSSAIVSNEEAILKAEAEKRMMELDAEAEKRKMELEAEAEKRKMELKAEAEANYILQIAEAQMQADKKKAEALAALGYAKAESLRLQVAAAGGTSGLIEILRIEDRQNVDIVKEAAAGLRDMKPTLFLTGNGGGDSGSTSSVFSDLAKSVLSMSMAIENRTGIDPIVQVLKSFDPNNKAAAATEIKHEDDK